MNIIYKRQSELHLIGFHTAIHPEHTARLTKKEQIDSVTVRKPGEK